MMGRAWNITHSSHSPGSDLLAAGRRAARAWKGRVEMQQTRTRMAGLAIALLVGLFGWTTQPAAAGQQPDAPENLIAISSVLRSRDAQGQIISTTDSYVQWEHPADTTDISCWYVRWRLAAKPGRQAGAWQPGEEGAIAPKYRDYHDIDGLTIGETYDFEVRSYSESLGSSSDWQRLNQTLRLASTDSSLKSLTLSSGTLAPAFEPERWSDVTYTATVPNTVTSVTFTPTANNEHATITFQGNEIVSGGASEAISLSPGPNHFQVRVAAEYSAWWRAYNLNVVRAKPAGSLAAPTNLTLAQTTADQKHRITLTWTPPTGATESVLEYRQVRAAESSPWSRVGVEELTTAGGKINVHLSHNVDYAVRVAGKNDSGIGAYATGFFTSYGTPYWPLNVAAASGDTSLVVTWNPPETVGGPGDVITGYAVRWRPLPEDPCCPWSDAHTQQVGNVETYTITGLTNQQTYEVQVMAFNRLAGGIWSRSIQGTPAEMQGSPPPYQGGAERPQTLAAEDADDTDATEPLAVPGVVRDVRAAIDGATVTVSWSAPEAGGAPGRYVVRLKSPKQGKAKIKRVDADATSVTFGRIKAGSHTVFVRAKNEAGGGKWTKVEITVP